MSNVSARLTMIVSSAVASGLALILMFWARSALQVRSLPERIMESVLLLVPPAQFEGAIEKYGPAAKEYALYGTTLVMFLALAVIGVLLLRFVRRPAGLLLAGIGLWLVAMLVIMPLTGAGVFATALFQSPALIAVIYLGVGLAYASVLLLGWLLAPPRAAPARAIEDPMLAFPARRAFLVGAGAAAAALVATVALGKGSTQVASSLPLASLPPAGQPAPAPAADGAGAAPTPTGGQASSASSGSAAPSSSTVGTGSVAANASASAGAAPASRAGATASAPSAASGAASPAAAASPVEYPVPPPEKPLARDKDGALLAVNRPKGQLQVAVTTNDDWYTVTKNAGGDPRLEARDWRLIVDGSVNRPVQLDYATLVRLPQVSIYKTLECISNLTAKCELTSFGCDLISTAKWTGARLTDVMKLAGGLKGGVVAIAAIGSDEFSSALPVAAASDPDVLLVYRMNDQPLPREHGFPVRVLIPDRYGMKNAKWIVNIKPMTQAYVDWYGQRNWSQQGIVKTMSRIDVPAPNAKVRVGANQIAGIAYAGSRGIAKVEFSADAGRTWQPATLEPALGKDTFIRWHGAFPALAGQTAQLVARATDGTGALQPETFNLPQPNGGSGWNSISVFAA